MFSKNERALSPHKQPEVTSENGLPLTWPRKPHKIVQIKSLA